MWRKKVDKSLKPFLEKYIEETHRYKTNFEQADDKGRAQVWIAIALLSKQLYNLEIKMNYLERAMKDISASKQGEKFLQEIEQKVKKPEKQAKEEKEKEIKKVELKEEIPTINLGHLQEDKVDEETFALGEGAEILSEIAKKKPKEKSKKKKRKKKR